MKYMLMIYDKPNTREVFSGPAGEELRAQMATLMTELTESGELVATEALADPSQTISVRSQDGVPVVTDGPLAEAKEHFGGYVTVDCETQERAVAIAKRWPGGLLTSIEVRPIMFTGGEEL